MTSCLMSSRKMELPVDLTERPETDWGREPCLGEGGTSSEPGRSDGVKFPDVDGCWWCRALFCGGDVGVGSDFTGALSALK